MRLKLKITILKLILVNTITVVGLLFFDWEIFEVVVIYILESLAIYVVFNVRYFFLEPKTNYPFPLALIQLTISLVPFVAILYAQVAIIYGILTPRSIDFALSFKFAAERVEDMELLIPLFSLICIETLTVFMQRRNQLKQTNQFFISYSRVFIRILFSTLYLIPASFIVFLFNHNFVVSVIFMIGLRFIMEYSIEDERVLIYLNHQRRRFIKYMSS